MAIVKYNNNRIFFQLREKLKIKTIIYQQEL